MKKTNEEDTIVIVDWEGIEKYRKNIWETFLLNLQREKELKLDEGEKNG